MPPSLAQLSFERLRADHAPDRMLPELTAVFERGRGFSDRIRELFLDRSEHRVLASIDGCTPLEGLSVRTGLSDRVVRRIAHSLSGVGLIAKRPSERPVMIVERDVEGFQRSLESMFYDRDQTIPIVALTVSDDLVETALRELPRTVILDAECTSVDMGVTVRALRSQERLRGVSLLALLNIPAVGRVPELEAAGFDAVLVKPVAYADLERWI
jgi:CheY-like chemotaxis protein